MLSLMKDGEILSHQFFWPLEGKRGSGRSLGVGFSRHVLRMLRIWETEDWWYFWFELSYCWWKKSCTSWYGKYPIIYRVSYIPGGAGFQPSTVSHPYALMFAYMVRLTLLSHPPLDQFLFEAEPKSLICFGILHQPKFGEMLFVTH